MPKIFKIIDAAVYANARDTGLFHGAEIDLKDGYIHFSDAQQVKDTARLHFAGREHLMLLAFEAQDLGEALKWEASRGGQLFPHLYATLDMAKLRWAKPLPWNGTAHDFPAETFA